MGTARSHHVLAALTAAVVLACSTKPTPEVAPAGAVATTSPRGGPTYPTSSDPRNGLKFGMLDAATAQSGMRLVSFTPKPAEFDSARGLTFINSDLAFRGNLVYQGNFSGFTIWDVSNPAKPTMV